MAICLTLCLLQWQQRVSYKIEAYLNAEEHSLKAVEYLTYHNNSSYSLETLYIHLYANAFRDEHTVYAQETKRMGDYDFVKSQKSEHGHIDIETIVCEGDSLNFTVDGTIMTVVLNKPLRATDSLTLRIESYLKIPRQFSRLGFKHNHYEMVQWYPKMCVFDENGWHRDTYHALGEFYGEYGCFDVTIDLPGDFVVAATGERMDHEDKIFIDSLIERGVKPAVGERKTVRFYAENIHDFAWVCDPDFLIKNYEVDSIAIFVFYLKQNEKSWRNAGVYARDAVTRYNTWFGQYPYKNLSLVNGYYSGGTEYPQLVIVGYGEDLFTRLFELVVIHEIGHQWFYGILGSNEVDEAWLDEGFTTYTEIRYVEDKYGKDNSLFKMGILPSLSRRYYHTLVYYVTQTNDLEKPILTPAYEHIDVPISYANSAYSKPALFLINLEGILGREMFDRILKKYFREYQFRHPRTVDFTTVCEEESGQDLKALFSQFFTTTDFSDWAVKNVSINSVEIENRGALQMPIDIFVETELGAHVFTVDAQKKEYTFVLPESAGKIKRVIIDPYGYSLEPNYWNNYYPRKIVIKPIFNLPSFDAYQIFFLPYLWYGRYDGITTGLFLFGSEFMDFDVIKGKHQWTAGCTYGFKSKNFYPAFSYQTPILFRKGVRSRVIVRGSNSNGEDKLSCGITNNFGIPFSQYPMIEARTLLSYYKLNSYQMVDSIDWEFGRNVTLGQFFTVTKRRWRIHASIFGSHEIIGSEWNYLKTTLEMRKGFETFVPFTVRFFAGRIFGDSPLQEKLFLSGALRISMLADLVFGQAGYFSPQEHIHISGDGNMLGYQTLHMKSDYLYCVNLEFLSDSPIRLFADLGYYGDYAADFGAKIVLGPLSFNFPFYTKTDEPWQLRWSIGF